MPYTNKERQKRFKEKMYKAGFKQAILWVDREESRRTVTMNKMTFIKRLEKLTVKWDEESLSQLYILLLKIAKGKKEAAGLKEKP
jgi:hypothetical protein